MVVRKQFFSDLNKLKQRPQKQMILFKPVSVLQLQSSGDKVSSRSSGKVNVPTLVPDWFDHPLGNYFSLF